MTLDGTVLGAPGVYFAPQVPQPRSATEPMDVGAFVGIAPRGPAFEPVLEGAQAEPEPRFTPSVAVPVDSWDEYVEAFGGFRGPGLLPHAVAAYFAQGARRAYVVRVVARPPVMAPDAEPPGCARYELAAGLTVRARNEGSWGDRLTIELVFRPRALSATVLTADGDGGRAPRVRLDAGSAVPAGALLRLRPNGRPDVLVTVERLVRVGRPGAAGHDVVAVLDRPAPDAGPETVVELVDVELTVTDREHDRDPGRRRTERFAGLGTRPAHPRFLGDVLRRESRLLAPVGAAVFDPPPDLRRLSVTRPDEAGEDRWHLVTEQDLFGVPGGEEDGTGIEALSLAPEVASLVVPDLYALPAAVAPPAVAVGGDAGFRPCLAAAPPSPVPVENPRLREGLVLDPTDPGDLLLVVGRQQRLVAAAERLRVVALLDVPPGVRGSQVLRWRSSFDSSFAAAYHPWLRVPGPDPAGPLVDLPPSAVAAGVIARCELRQGISRGPANELAAGVVDVAESVGAAAQAELHRLGIDVLRMQPDGVWLTGARTLSADPSLRQLTVRRLLLMLERIVGRQLGWAVFEPADGGLRAGLRRHLDQVLGDLFDAGAFAGATPAESWFVLVGPPEAEGPGRLVVQIGVAPSEPMEFIVVRVVLDAEGAVELHLETGGARIPGTAVTT